MKKETLTFRISQITKKFAGGCICYVLYILQINIYFKIEMPKQYLLCWPYSLFILNVKAHIPKGIEFLPQTQIFSSLYLGNLMMETLDISILGYLI